MNWLARLLSVARGESHVQGAPRFPSVAMPSRDISDNDDCGQYLRAGNSLLAESKIGAAIEQYRLAVRSDPRNLAANVNLGFALLENGQTSAAIDPLRQALTIDADSADANYLLGAALLAQHQAAFAATHLQRAIALQPALMVGYRDLGKALHQLNRHDEAKIILRAGLAIDSSFVDFHYFLGNIALHQMQFEEAMANYQNALSLQPDHAAVYNNLSQVLLNLCDFKGAALAARKSLAIDPLVPSARSNLLMSLSCDADCTPAEYLAEAKIFGQLMASKPLLSPSTAFAQPDSASREWAAERRPRIGFVSGDLHNHPVGYFLEAVLSHWHAGPGLEVYAYANGNIHDELSTRLKAHFAEWREISILDDEATASLIKSDCIDVLVDLSGHTAENRLPMFARRAAPVQVSWLGYWASTGLPEMDYVLADRYSVPDEHRCHFVEQIRHLPDTRLCFSPPNSGDAPDVSVPPASISGRITFGSFQRMTKLNGTVLSLWGRVLSAVPNSRLRLQSAQMASPAARSQLQEALTRAGVDISRVQLVEAGSRMKYLEAHAEVDILLDTFPHSGATTTCEALWMGVPTITLAGPTMLGRQGVSLLQNAGLSNWIANTHDEYVSLAVGHSADFSALSELRSNLRAQVLKSPLFDAENFARQFQDALTDLWRRRGKQGSLVARLDDSNAR
jgi:protein O-GlcNAc transferase